MGLRGVVGKETNQINNGISNSLSKLTPEMEAKILEGQRVTGTNKIIGGHSPNINNANPRYAVETINLNPDGTRTVKYITQFNDGNLSKFCLLLFHFVLALFLRLIQILLKQFDYLLM
ncbi:hypothetical protein A9G29_11060 [Gilliamella sp. Fer2-1]|nr:hypothetical protein A9G29_11060 [Gilliamella apicola]